LNIHDSGLVLGHSEIAAMYIDESLLPKNHSKEPEETPAKETPTEDNTPV
jgi:hypothetical protein